MSIYICMWSILKSLQRHIFRNTGSTSIPTNKARSVSPIFSSVHHRKYFLFYPSWKFICVCLLGKEFWYVRRALWPSKQAPLVFRPRSWEISIFRTGQQIVGVSHRTTNTGLDDFSLFLCFTSIFILLSLYLFSFPSLYFFWNLFRKLKILKKVQNKKS